MATDDQQRERDAVERQRARDAAVRRADEIEEEDEGGEFVPGTRIRFLRESGPLLAGADVHPIFWGRDWDTPALREMKDHVLSFFDILLGETGNDEARVHHEILSALLDFYADPEDTNQNKRFLSGRRRGDRPPEKAPGATVDDNDIRDLLREVTNDGRSEDHSWESLYFVFPPPGTEVTFGPYRSCAHFCGYHRVIDDTKPWIVYVVVPYPRCLGCTRGLSLRDALTTIASHEFINAVTDPVFGTGIFDPAHNELSSVSTKYVVEMPVGGTTYVRRAVWASEPENEEVEVHPNRRLERRIWRRGRLEERAISLTDRARAIRSRERDEQPRERGERR